MSEPQPHDDAPSPTATGQRKQPVQREGRDRPARLVGGLGGVLVGVAGVAVALGLGELMDGLFNSVPSLVVAVGEVLVDYSPDWAVRLSIEWFGENDKNVAVASVALGALAVGAVAASVSLRRNSHRGAYLAFGVLGIVGGWAMARNPQSPAVGSWIAALICTLGGVGALLLVVRLGYGSLTATANGPGAAAQRSAIAVPPAGGGTAGIDTGEAPAPVEQAETALGLPVVVAAASAETAGATAAAGTDRRRFLFALAGAGAGAVGLAAVGRQLRTRTSVEAARTAITLPPAAAPVTTAAASSAATTTTALAAASAPQSVAAAVAALETLDEVPGISPYVVPNGQFYRIDTALTVPQVDPAAWQLDIGGLVDNPYTLTLDDILAMDLREYVITLSCVSNRVGGNLVGNAVWTGVPLADLLERAGPQPEATQVAGRSVDDWTAGFPTDAVFDGRNAILAVGMNGEPLPTRHGFPARLVVAGLYGYVSAVKWIRQIELTTWEGFDGYWIPRKWSKRGPMKTQSRIDVPGNGNRPVAGQATPVAGIAWAPTRGISKVEVRFDGGAWQECELGEAFGDESWVQWATEWTPSAGSHTVQVRATDGTGMTQPEGPKDPRPDGAEGWHQINVQAV